MRRKEFLRELKFELRKRRDIEVEEVIYYYDELIQDAVDNGENEAMFIQRLGNVKNIARKIIDDEEFLIEVKAKNRVSLQNALGLTVKILGFFIFGVLAFVIVVTSFSLFVSGVAIIFSTIIGAIQTPPVDSYGYIMLFGFAAVGISLMFISFGLSQIFFKQAKSALLSIFRKLSNISRREGK